VKHPGFEVALPPEKVAVFQNPEEGILDQILAEVPVFAKPIKETIQRPFIAFKEQTQPVQVTVPDFDHQ